MKKERKTQKQVYNDIKSIMIERGFNKFNTTVLTLLLPLNDFSNDSQLLRKVKRLFKNLELDFIVVIEPVIVKEGNDPFRPNYYESRYFHSSSKFLPIYHAHVIIKAKPEEVNPLRLEWQKVVRSKRSELFRCEPIKKSIPELVNYVTKYYEEKRFMEPMYTIQLRAAVEVEESQFHETETTLAKKSNQLPIHKRLTPIYRTIMRLPYGLLKWGLADLYRGVSAWKGL